MYRYAIAVLFVFNVWDLAASQQDCRPKDCYDLKCYKVSKAMDGPHTIYPDTPDLTNFSLQVSCDQETGGGGWIMYMRRLNGTVDFSRNWDDYKRGFGQNGDNMTELWLGNENVYQVLQSYGTTECELRIEMDAWDETERWLVASNVRMNNETSKYTLNWDNVTGPYPEIYSNWNYHKLLEFRTNDSENPHCVGSVDQYTGGWWYECSSLFLTGKYVNQEVKTYKSISVVDSKHGYPLKRARLMLRPTNDNRSCNNPCKNGGTCEHVADPIGHHCACTPEWCGATCEVMNPCNNSGKCEAEQLPTGDYRTNCTCTTEWCGVTCELMNPCKNGGKCEAEQLPMGDYRTNCTCTPEWCGVTCEVLNPCNNSGKCEAEQLPTGDYRTYCTCTPEWCGVTCEVLNPCNNSGKCEAEQLPTGDYRTYCACTPEWCGVTCELTNPCKNGGKCEAEQLPMGDYRTNCTCTPEWCGVTCDVVNPCKNGGVCEVDEMTNTTTCNCDAEFTGVTCESVTRGDAGGEDTTLGVSTQTAAPEVVDQEDTVVEDTVVEEYIDDDILLEDVTDEDTTAENTTGQDRPTTSEDMTGENMTGEDTNGDEPDPAALGVPSAVSVTRPTNCGVIVALLILRRPYFGFFGFFGF